MVRDRTGRAMILSLSRFWNGRTHVERREFDERLMAGYERGQRQQEPWKRDEQESDESGPERPDVQRPNKERLLKRMKRVDREQSKRYRQRTGE